MDGAQQDVDLLVLDQPADEDDVRLLCRCANALDGTDVDPVPHDPCVHAMRTGGQPVGGEPGDGHPDVAQRPAAGLGQLARLRDRRSIGEVGLPVVAPELVPGGDERSARGARGEPGRVQREVGRGRAVDDVIPTRAQRREQAHREGRRLAHRASAVLTVEGARVADPARREAGVPHRPRRSPVPPGDVVHLMAGAEARGELEVTALRSALQVRIEAVIHVGNLHQGSDCPERRGPSMGNMGPASGRSRVPIGASQGRRWSQRSGCRRGRDGAWRRPREPGTRWGGP